MRTRVLLLAAVVLPAVLFAYPGFGGGKGLFRVQNALVEPEAGLTVSLHALARKADFFMPESATKSGWIADLIAPELSYAPVVNKYVGVELFGSWGGAFQNPKSYSADGFVWGFEDLKAGGKVSIPFVKVFKVGGAANYTFKYRETKAGWTVLDPEALPYNSSKKLAWNGLVTLQFQDLSTSAPNLILNYGKVAGLTQYAAGLELQGTGFGVFVEGVSLQPSGKGMFNTDGGHIHLTPGFVLGNATSSFLKLGYTFSSGKVNGVKQPNEIILGLGVATPFGSHKPAATGQIVGTVTDASTGKPIADASIVFPDNPKLAAMVSDADGVFQTKKVPVGAVTVDVSAAGYNKQVVPLAVEENNITNYDFKLRPLKTYGTIAGTVVDATTNAPMAARIEFPGSALAPVNADPATGAFKLDKVETGVYTLTANADKYVPATMTLSVEENKLATAAFKLSPTATAVAITGKVSDKKTGDALAATVTFPEAGNAVFRTDPSTGVYKAQLMPGSYTAVVEAKDYVKQTSAFVVEKGKPQVMDFQLVKVGMSITLKGIYFDFNKATIKPESKPALDDAAKILKDNPSIKVEIQGHTDSVGSSEYNMQLSQRRAQAVVDYLVQNYGITVDRLTARGYGKTMPIAPNSTPEGRALNRRVEFVILSQ